MKRRLKRSALGSTVLLVALLALQQAEPWLPDHGVAGWLRIAVAQARGRNPLWWDGLWKASNGYYENLLGGDDPAAAQTLITRVLRGKLPWGMMAMDHQIYNDVDFLLWTPKPNLDFDDRREGPTKTNADGLFGLDHARQKPPGVRRIAILGDSLTRGWGVPLNQRFTSVLQQRFKSEPGQPVEMINFAVPGYRLTQMFDVALEKVPAYHPDVYLLVLTDLCMTPRWGSHVITLVQKEHDLKYDFLRQIVQESGLRKGDSPSLADWKLAPYRVPASREMLLRLKDHADHESAQLMVVLVPAVEDSYVIRRHFNGVKSALQGTGIPVLDLRDTFDGSDVESERTDWFDPHPNQLGNRMIADNFYRKLREQPELWTALLGKAR